MTFEHASCEQRIRQQLVARDRAFADIWQRVQGDGNRAALFRALDPLSMAGEPVISVQFNRARSQEWLQIHLSETAPGGVDGVTYHCADVADHAEWVISETSGPALWLAATYYADLAAHQLLTRRQREGC